MCTTGKAKKKKTDPNFATTCLSRSLRSHVRPIKPSDSTHGGRTEEIIGSYTHWGQTEGIFRRAAFRLPVHLTIAKQWGYGSQDIGEDTQEASKNTQ